MINDHYQILYSTLLGAIVAALGFVAGNLLAVVFVNPLQESRKLRGEVSLWVAYYQMNRSLPKEHGDRVQELCAKLHASPVALPCYEFFSSLGLVLKRADVERAARMLMQAMVATQLGQDDTVHKNMEVVSKLLNVREASLITAEEQQR